MKVLKLARFWVLSLATISLSVLLAAPSGAASGYGPRLAHSTPAPGLHAVHEYTISDQKVRQLVLRSKFGQSAASRLLHRVTTPLPLKSQARYSFPDNTTSPTWAGYVDNVDASTNAVLGVQGEFTVSAVGAGGDMASWAGIGGSTGDTVIQTGVDSTLPGHPAWFEFFPSPPVYMFDTNPGDVMLSIAQLDEDNGSWAVLIEDLTSGFNFADEFNFPGADTSSAEWITEIVGGTGPVPGFSSPVQFANAAWLDVSGNFHDMVDFSDGDTFTEAVALADPQGGHVFPSFVGGDFESFANSPAP